jgi:hypothetical protein
MNIKTTLTREHLIIELLTQDKLKRIYPKWYWLLNTFKLNFIVKLSKFTITIDSDCSSFPYYDTYEVKKGKKFLFRYVIPYKK